MKNMEDFPSQTEKFGPQAPVHWEEDQSSHCGEQKLFCKRLTTSTQWAGREYSPPALPG